MKTTFNNYFRNFTISIVLILFSYTAVFAKKSLVIESNNNYGVVMPLIKGDLSPTIKGEINPIIKGELTTILFNSILTDNSINLEQYNFSFDPGFFFILEF